MAWESTLPANCPNGESSSAPQPPWNNNVITDETGNDEKREMKWNALVSLAKLEVQGPIALRSAPES
jgi:hypothetical protein